MSIVCGKVCCSRKMIQVATGVVISEQKKNDTSSFLRILTYNTLAQHLVRRPWFPYTSKEGLKWNFRKKHLLHEFEHLISTHDPHIMCLQEIDVKFYTKTWSKSLNRWGYDSQLLPKQENGYHGVVIGWNRDRFSKVHECEIQLDDDDQFHNAALITALCMINEPSSCVIVATTHLHWHPHMSYIRLKQVQQLLTSVVQLKQDVLEKYDHITHVEIIIAGDFNTTPLDPVYSYMTKRTIEDMQRLLTTSDERKETFDEEERRKAIESVMNESYKLPILNSAYGVYRNGSNEPEYTTITHQFADTLDYIFTVNSDASKLKLHSLLEIPKKEDIQCETVGIPNNTLSSDHFALIAQYTVLYG